MLAKALQSNPVLVMLEVSDNCLEQEVESDIATQLNDNRQKRLEVGAMPCVACVRGACACVRARAYVFFACVHACVCVCALERVCARLREQVYLRTSVFFHAHSTMKNAVFCFCFPGFSRLFDVIASCAYLLFAAKMLQ